jgi:hypothetical protein
VDHPAGFNDLHERAECVEALVELKRKRPELGRAVIKLNEGFSGEGNAMFRYPESFPTGVRAARTAVKGALDRLEWNAEAETVDDYFRKLRDMGGIVEEFVDAPEVRSPSAQMRVYPDGSLDFISTHDQVLGGVTGQAYVGCRFPASEEYRAGVRDATVRVAEVLRDEGVVSRFGVDFLATRRPGEDWRLSALEINLRMGGTTHPFQALQFLTSGQLDPETGMYVTPAGRSKYYFSTDGLNSPSYLGLLPEDLMDIVTFHGLSFRPDRQTGVLFHMIGALSQFGKVGVTCIGDTREEADRLYQWTVQVLDRETGASEDSGGSLRDPFHDRLPIME